MRVYQIIKIDKDGKRWTSPNLSSLKIVDKVSAAVKGDRTIIKELRLEKTGFEAAKKYAMNTLFPSEKNAIENRSSSLYLLGSDVYLQRKSDSESTQEETESFLASLTDERGKKKIYYIGYQNEDKSLSEIYATADDYVKARDVAVEFSKMMQSKKMAIIETYVYFNADKCIYDIKQKLFEKPEMETIWLLGTPEEASHYEMATELADLEKKYQRVLGNNRKLKDKCKELEGTITDWEAYSDTLADRVTDEKQKRVNAERELADMHRHPLKSIFGGRSKQN